MILKSSHKERNIFVNFLDLLKVKHTDLYSNKYYGEHPYKYSMYGLSKMLSEYGIENAGLKIEDKAGNISLLEVPYIAYLGSDFVIVYKIAHEKVYYVWRGKEISIPVEEFNKRWSGVVLLAEPNENSIEPNYKESKKKEIFQTTQKYLLFLSVCALIALFFLKNRLYANIGQTLVLFVNLIGVYIGYLLVQKQMHIHSAYADKICSLFKKSDCNNVLETKAAKLWGVISLSEVGLSYFISNTMLILLVPRLITYLAVINLFGLPFCFWSVWYQKVKAKQWCPLCLIVQALLFTLFIVDVIFGFIQLPLLNMTNVLLTGCLYLIPFLMIDLLLPPLIEGRKVTNVTQEMNGLKANKDVFMALLKKRPHYNVEKSTSHILLGNESAATLITIQTNPHCEPCAKMHARVENLLKESGNNLCIQYIFSSFNESLESSNKFLIASYFNNERNTAKDIFDMWYKDGKYKKEDIFSSYNYDIEDKNVLEEFHSHKKWVNETKIGKTPTILVNGYELPEEYKIEDLAFLNLDVDSK
jgi:uncharacterized membrane protein/thiol-disulfide isomerase/thioredoxin